MIPIPTRGLILDVWFRQGCGPAIEILPPDRIPQVTWRLLWELFWWEIATLERERGQV